MKKTKFYLLFSALLSAQTSFAGICGSSLKNNDPVEMQNNSKNEEPKKLEHFDFENLPEYLQNKIVDFAWETLDTESFSRPTRVTSIVNNPNKASQRLLDGDKEFKRRILFYTLQDNKPILKKIGTITKLKNDSNKAKLSLEKPFYLNLADFFESREIDLINMSNINISSACLSACGYLAITWNIIKKENNFVTFLHLNDMKYSQHSDLKKNPISLKDSLDQVGPISGSLFTLDGTKLGVRFYEYLHLNRCTIEITSNNPHFIITPSKNEEELTSIEKAKRMGIPTDEVKALLSKTSTKMNRKKSLPFEHPTYT